MAKHTRKPPDPPPAPWRPEYAWHIVTTNGSDATVTAHECQTSCGVLKFIRYDDPEQMTESLVRAFATSGWKDCERVDVPVPVNTPPH